MFRNSKTVSFVSKSTINSFQIERNRETVPAVGLGVVRLHEGTFHLMNTNCSDSLAKFLHTGRHSQPAVAILVIRHTYILCFHKDRQCCPCRNACGRVLVWKCCNEQCKHVVFGTEFTAEPPRHDTLRRSVESRTKLFGFDVFISFILFINFHIISMSLRLCE